MKLLCPDSDPQFEQNVLDAQKRREGLDCRLSGKASFTEMHQRKQADPPVQSAGTTKVSCLRILQEVQVKASDGVKTRSTLDELKVI